MTLSALSSWPSSEEGTLVVVASGSSMTEDSSDVALEWVSAVSLGVISMVAKSFVKVGDADSIGEAMLVAMVREDMGRRLERVFAR